MFIIYCDGADCVKDRRTNPTYSEEFSFVLSTMPFDYECCLSSSISNHSHCLLCRHPDRGFEFCYVFRNGCVDENNIIYKFAIPVDKYSDFLKRGQDVLDLDAHLSPGPILCPFHADSKKSAILNKDGSVWCFAEQKLFSSAEVKMKTRIADSEM